MEFVSRAGQVKRYHTWPVLLQETVAAHSFEVAWLCDFIWGEAQGASAGLLRAALAHDLAEHLVGDHPADAKRRLDAALHDALTRVEEAVLEEHDFAYHQALTPEEAQVLRMADSLALMMHCVRERRLGNAGIAPVFARGSIYAEQRIKECSKNQSIRGRAELALKHTRLMYKEACDA